MRLLLPVNMFAACCFIGACNQTKPTIFKDNTTDYKRFWTKYTYASSLLGHKNDSAFFYFSQIANNSSDSLLVAGSYTEMGIIQNDAGDYYGSQESLLLSLGHLNEAKKEHRVNLACTYNELGVNSSDLKNFDEAIFYFTRAIHFSYNDSIRIINTNNKANAFRDKKDYDEAIETYYTALKLPENTPRQYARILSNLAYTLWLKNPGYNAAPELRRSLQIRKNEDDGEGLITSYHQLSDYYKNLRPDSALFYARHLYSMTQLGRSPDDELHALSTLIPLDKASAFKAYFVRLQFLSDSLQTARARAKNQFAVIRYETEKHKADKLMLQKENTEAKLRVVWQQVISVFLVTVSIILFIWYRKRKQQAIKEQQLLLSKKVHDKVANGIYRIMSEVEHRGIGNPGLLLDKLESVYNLSRDISYDQPHTENQEYYISVSELLDSFNSDKTQLSVTGNTPGIWENLVPDTRQEISLVLQELMTNMKKHSEADKVDVIFSKEAGQLTIDYTDNGIGLLPSFKYGNGLTNTENRIAGLNGRLIFDQASKKGLRIKIFIPIV